MRLITLSKGLESIVDDEDFEWVSKHKWSASKSDHSFYAMRAQGPRGNQKFFYLHRVIIGAEKGQLVDHIDRNTLNNSRSNLRLVSVRQNAMNTGSHRNSISQFKGVWPNAKAGKPWAAGISLAGKRIHLGHYATEMEAAQAYDAAARRESGQFANLNFGGNHE